MFGDLAEAGHNPENLNPPPRRRSRRSSRTRLSKGRSAYDWTVIGLLLLVPTLAVIIFGGIGPPTYTLLIVLTFFTGLLFFGRSVVSEERHLLRLPPGFLLLVLFFFFVLGVTYTSTLPWVTRTEWLKIGSVMLAYWMWTMLSFPYKRWRFLLGWVFLLVSMICLYALILHGKDLRLVLYQERPAGYEMRASGTYYCPNHFANLIDIMLCMAVAVLFMPAGGAILRIVSGYAILVSLPVLFLTHSRGGWLGAIGGLCVTTLILAWTKSRKLFMWYALSIPALLFIGGAIVWEYSPEFKERILSAAPTGNYSTAQIRLGIWKDSLEMIKEEPPTGYGGGTFRWHYPRFQTVHHKLWARYAHNDYLQLLIEYGIPGLLLFGAFWLFLIVKLIRKIPAAAEDRDLYLIAGLLGAMAAYMITALFDFPFHLFANLHVLALFGGIVSAALFTSGTIPTKQAGPPLRIGLSVVMVVLLVALILPASRRFMTKYNYSKGTHLLLEGIRSFDNALGYFKKANKNDPGYWEPYLALADDLSRRNALLLNAEMRMKNAEEAKALYTKAYELNPYDARSMAGIADAWEALGDWDQSMAWKKRAIDNDPYNENFLKQYALKWYEAGDLDKALEYFTRSVTLDLEDPVSVHNIEKVRTEIAIRDRERRLKERQEQEQEQEQE
ncbi:MAG: O-antigen ligase family protein [Verrucomicrobiota bacterium]